MRDVAIVGLGLIGGSLAAAITERALGRVTAIDRAEVVQSAAAAAITTERVDAADEDAVVEALQRAEVAVLAVPVRAIEAELPRVLALAKVVTDCGSTKRAVARAAAAAARARRFVPGHPMAGAPTGGLAHARADLFVGRRWILCPEGSDPDAAEVVAELASGVGADVVRMTAIEHDRVVAMTSHVPQLLASVLAVLGARRSALAGAGPAYSSATLRAGGAEGMWRDIFATNGDEIAAALWDVAQEIELVAAGLGKAEPDLRAAMELLARARSLRER